jgi:hypothetical protein
MDIDPTLKYTIDVLVAQGSDIAIAAATKLAKQSAASAPAAPATPATPATGGPLTAAILADPTATLDHAVLKSFSQRAMGELMSSPAGRALVDRSMVALGKPKAA